MNKITNSKLIIKKLLREHINLTITDETPDSISVLVQYNERNAGVITVAPANDRDDMLEIVAIKFKKDYETLFIIAQAVKSLFLTFKNIDNLIVAPLPEAIQFWNTLGFNRISKNYLILKRAA
jgi:hypothetical protein